jgi:hypothetical protein
VKWWAARKAAPVFVGESIGYFKLPSMPIRKEGEIGPLAVPLLGSEWQESLLADQVLALPLGLACRGAMLPP